MPSITNATIERLLSSVQKPARYIGGELNQTVKPAASFRMAISYPDLYDVGMSNLGIRILYDIVNRIDGWACERVFAPAADMEQSLRESGISLFTLETHTPLHELDTIGFNLSHELLYTTVLHILDLGGIPLHRDQRTEQHPVIIAGGETASNPLPMLDFIDAFCIGEGEAAIVDICRSLSESKSRGLARQERIDRLADIPGIFVSAHHPSRNPGGTDTVASVPRITKRVHRSEIPLVPAKPIVPSMRIVQERPVVEVTRGCANMCKFCHAGYFNLPYRSYHPDALVDRIFSLLDNTGYNEISLASLSLSDYRHLVPLLNAILPGLTRRGVSLSFPSLRVDSGSIDIIEHSADIRKSTLTFAVESAEDAVRYHALKKLRISDLMEILDAVIPRGWRAVKLYFMIGLPGFESGSEAGAIMSLLKELQSRYRKKLEINVTLSPFVPKPWTPYQWEAQAGLDYFVETILAIKRGLPRSVTIKNHDPHMSVLEGVLSRGDERLGRTVERAYQCGARFDSWKEYFNYERWISALDATIPEWHLFTGARNKNLPLPWDFIDAGCDHAIRHNCNRIYAPKPQPGMIRKEKIDTAAIANAMDDFKQKYATTHRLRIRFTKTQWAKYIPYIDFMEIVKRSLRMLKVPVAFTQGFNKHEKISSGFPLPLGIMSIAELFDVELYAGIDIPDLLGNFNARLPSGITACAIRALEKGESLMSSTAALSFTAAILDASIVARIEKNIAANISIEKKTDKGIVHIPASDAILNFCVRRADSAGEITKYVSHPVDDYHAFIDITVPIGNAATIRIDELLRTLSETGQAGITGFEIVKTGQYRKDGGSLIEIV